MRLTTAPLRPFGRSANRSAETLLGTVDTSWEERQRDKGMALTFKPSDLIEQAAREENWTDSVHAHAKPPIESGIRWARENGTSSASVRQQRMQRR